MNSDSTLTYWPRHPSRRKSSQDSQLSSIPETHVEHNTAVDVEDNQDDDTGVFDDSSDVPELVELYNTGRWSLSSAVSDSDNELLTDDDCDNPALWFKHRLIRRTTLAEEMGVDAAAPMLSPSRSSNGSINDDFLMSQAWARCKRNSRRRSNSDPVVRESNSGHGSVSIQMSDIRSSAV